MTSVEAEASSLLRELAKPAIPGESIKAVIGRAARISGLRYWRVYRLWYGRIEPSRLEMEELRRKAVRAAQQEEEQDAERGREFVEVLARLERIEAFMARMDSRMESRPDGREG